MIFANKQDLPGSMSEAQIRDVGLHIHLLRPTLTLTESLYNHALFQLPLRFSTSLPSGRTIGRSGPAAQ